MREFQRTCDAGRPHDTRHHEQIESVQKAFAKDVKSLITVIEEMGNPFCEGSAHCIVLKIVKGQSIYDKYVKKLAS